MLLLVDAQHVGGCGRVLLGVAGYWWTWQDINEWCRALVGVTVLMKDV